VSWTIERCACSIPRAPNSLSTDEPKSQQHYAPAVLAALNPLYGLRYLFSNGYASFLVLGGVFLCVTGAEALYADMGHFGSRPIRFTWSGIVLPSLLLNYAGQSAIVLEGTPTTDNIFYRLCPEPLLIPFVVLATIATIIASQAIITGAFSMTRQAIQLGWLPRLRIVQTSEKGYGQIYVGVINWLLMIVTVGLTLFFGKSDNLAAAYGIAVSATMMFDLGPAIHRDARCLGLEVVDERGGRGCVPLHRCGFLPCESRQGGSGRLRSVASGRIGLWDHADLAPRIYYGYATSRRADHPG
jgi:K+ potassium transporter